MNCTARGVIARVAFGLALIATTTPLHASAARLSFGMPHPVSRPSSISNMEDVALPIHITLSSGECINAAEIAIVVSRPTLLLNNRDITSDFFDIWNASNDENGHLHFILGTTDMICGDTSGDTLEIARITAARSSLTKTILSFGRETSVALADGKGTLAELETSKLRFR